MTDTEPLLHLDWEQHELYTVHEDKVLLSVMFMKMVTACEPDSALDGKTPVHCNLSFVQSKEGKYKNKWELTTKSIKNT
jgi:hypothetical protein